jgi:hypothetical protein
VTFGRSRTQGLYSSLTLQILTNWTVQTRCNRCHDHNEPGAVKFEAGAGINEKCYIYIILFLKADFQIMCQLMIRSTILKNVSPSHMKVTYHMETSFFCFFFKKKLRSGNFHEINMVR